MADALEAVWKDMQQETPQEFIRRQGHLFLLAPVLIVLISESDLSLFQLFQSVIGDGNPVRFGARQKLPSRAALELPPLRTGSGNAEALVIIRAGGAQA